MKTQLTALALGTLIASAPVYSADYVIDTKGAHASIHFAIQHLGYSWLRGRFNDFQGTFSYDAADPGASKVSVEIDTASLDSNHAERDKHLRGDDFLAVEEYPKAAFVSTAFQPQDDGSALLEGDFTFHGVTKPLTIEVHKVGEGDDPWGGYRAGFEGTTSFALKDYGIDYDLGPASQTVEITLSVEGVRQ